jgi:antitoxin VapB
MAISIRKQSVETKARHVAMRRGLTMTGAIELALDNEIARDKASKEAEFERVWTDLQEISRSYMAKPATGLTEQDIMGWDENGLPS